jgi:Cu-Zn family superoxide dismutase
MGDSMRKLRPVWLVAIAATLLAGLGVFGMTSALATGVKPAKAAVVDVNGNSLGTVILQPIGNKLAIAGRLTGIAPGFHGFHIHSVGVCDPHATDATGAVVPFASAGGHLNPGGATHGHHAGDLPVLFVSADGKASAAFETDSTTFAQIFDADGAAMIIHAGPDNLANIPTRYSAAGVAGPDAATLATGDSGGRFACGVITK